jgi:ferredoxin-type protein NapG
VSGPGDLSRRALGGSFLRAIMRAAGASDPGSEAAAAAASARRRAAFPVHRPPGAVDEETFLRDCTRCDACLEACPHDAIIHGPPRFRQAAGTPMIDPHRAPCRMCADLPCVAACEPGVLSIHVPVKMARALITEPLCLAHMGTSCTVCFEQCPVEGAITMTAGKPRIDDDRCTGCGVCHYVCPAPENAVIVMPLADRPRTPAPGPGPEGAS